MSDEEELDIVRSLELTAEGSYDDGYAAGLAAADEQVQELVGALEMAIELIKMWYPAGQDFSSIDLAWQAYYNHAPEMKPIAAVLRKHGKE